MIQQIWDDTVQHWQGHLLQSWRWGAFKSRFGWSMAQVQVDRAAAQVLFRRLPLGLSIAYIPKGPLLDWRDSTAGHTLLRHIHRLARRKRAVFLKVEPNIEQSNQAAAVLLWQAGFQLTDTIQPQTTIVVDLRPTEADILAAMKQKTRYNIRLARKKGVTIRYGTSADVPTFYELGQLTANREAFGLHDMAYYQTLFEMFAPDHAALVFAEHEGDPLAALMILRQGEEAYYFYGASADHKRNLMPTYLAQWGAMQWAKRHGCTRYDLWGIPDADEATLEANFQTRHDGLWGVYRFKRGFGGRVERTLGGFDYIYNWPLYQLYRWWRR